MRDGVETLACYGYETRSQVHPEAAGRHHRKIYFLGETCVLIGGWIGCVRCHGKPVRKSGPRRGKDIFLGGALFAEPERARDAGDGIECLCRVRTAAA